MNLEEVYYQPGASRSIPQVYKRACNAGIAVSVKQVREFVERQTTHQLHIRKKRQILNPQRPADPRLRFEADLADMRRFRGGGFRYILIVIDPYSNYTWLRALTDKSAKNVSEAFDTIFTEIGRNNCPIFLNTDAGKEFRGETERVFTEFQIIHVLNQHTTVINMKCLWSRRPMSVYLL